MTLDELKAEIRKEEGYVPTVYKDSLGKRTCGYGHLCVEDFWEDGKEYDKKFLEEIFDKDFDEAYKNGHILIEDNQVTNIEEQAKHIIIHMVYQLGIGNVGKFKKMFAALRDKNYYEAAEQMINSRWHSQTKSRCERLSKEMQSCAD